MFVFSWVSLWAEIVILQESNLRKRRKKCYSSKNITLTQTRQFSHYPLKIADHVYIGPGSIVEAALIGNHVSIGANCVIGKFTIIKDYVKILDGSVVPPNMVIPSFSVVAGRPARVVGEIAEGEVDGMDLREIYRAVGNN
jgi:dynactin-5